MPHRRLHDTDPTGPQGFTAEQARDYFEWHVQCGRGKDIVALDRRGLDYLLEKHLPTRGLTAPPEEEQHGGGRVFMRLAY